MTERKLNDWITSYMEYAYMTEPPKRYHLWSAISVIAACLQRKCFYFMGSIEVFPNMYIALVGPPAARKGTAMDIAFPFIERLNIKVAAEAITREALIRELANSTDNDLDLKTGNRCFHSSLTIWSQELAVFLGYNNRQLISDLTDWYDCKKHWTYRTKSMGEDEIHGIYVNTLGAITPDLLRATMPIEAIGGGLTSRFMFIFEWDKEKIVPVSKLKKSLLPNMIHDLEQIRMLSGEFTYSPEMEEMWIEWYSHHEENLPFKDPKFDGYFQRRGKHVLKLAMILSASRSNSMVITGNDFQNALNYVQDAEKNMMNTFNGIGRASHADVLSKIMVNVSMAGQSGIRVSDLLCMHKSDIDVQGLEKVICTLEAMNFIQRKVYPDDTLIVYKVPEIRGLH